MAVITEHADDAFDFPIESPHHPRKRSRKLAVTLALAAAIAGTGWMVKGRGVVTSAVRMVYPDYRVVQYPPRVMTTSPGDGDANVAIGATISADLKVARQGLDAKSINKDSVF